MSEDEYLILLERQAKRIKELEADNKRMKAVIAINTHFKAERCNKYGDLQRAVWQHCNMCDGEGRGVCQVCSLVAWRPPEQIKEKLNFKTVIGDWSVTE